MQNRRSGFTVMRKLIVLVKPLTGFMFLAIFMGLLGHLVATFITILGAYAVWGFTEHSLKITTSTIFTLMIIFAGLRGILRYAEQMCNHYIAFKLLALLRDKVFIALRKLCPAKLEGRGKGDLISVITSDIELLEVFYAHTVSPAAIALLFSIFMSVFIGLQHPILGAIAAIAYLVIGLLIPTVTSGMSKDKGLIFRNKSGNLSSFVLDSLHGLSEILQYGQGENRILNINKLTDDLSADEKALKKIGGKNTALTNTLIFYFDILILIAAIILQQKNSISTGQVLISVISLMSSFGPVVALAALGSTLQNTFASGNRVLDILEEEPLINDIEGKETITFHHAKAKNVSFSYGDEEVLKNISVDIKKSQIVGIRGKSGSGKSTLLKLFMRFWTTDKGSLSISDTDINQINTINLRDMESFVTQDTHLFHDSIANNIKIAKLDASLDEIKIACKKASIHDFIMALPKGYDTEVGELGDTLSGGEKQRIGLARAFLHNADFMLLDEPTSNLDSINEAIILKALFDERAEKTVVLVSHRQSTMNIADTVYSVESGRIS